MLQVKKNSTTAVDKSTGKPVTVDMFTLDGDINQDSNLAGRFEVSANRVVVNCKGLRAINSIGVKEWILFFDALRQKGVELHFEECSSAMVYQVNLMPNFALLKEVDSFYATFLCAKCESEELALLVPSKLNPQNLTLPAVACKKCGGACDLDELPEEYFSFLS